jgi:hypothetical protein
LKPTLKNTFWINALRRRKKVGTTGRAAPLRRASRIPRARPAAEGAHVLRVVPAERRVESRLGKRRQILAVTVVWFGEDVAVLEHVYLAGGARPPASYLFLTGRASFPSAVFRKCNYLPVGNDRLHLLEVQLPGRPERIAFQIGLPLEHLPRLLFHPLARRVFEDGPKSSTPNWIDFYRQ